LITDDEDFKTRFNDLSDRKVIKHHLLIKSLFYLLEYNKDLICVPDSQMFFWKTARHHWNADMINKMKEFQIENKKDRTVKSYHTLNFVEKMLATVTLEELNKYNYSMGIVFKWMQIAIEYRKKNIISRLNNSKKLREEREKKIEEE
jgi:hypothetical protein